MTDNQTRNQGVQNPNRENEGQYSSSGGKQSQNQGRDKEGKFSTGSSSSQSKNDDKKSGGNC